MLSPVVFVCAGLLDLLIGDPDGWPHPVKVFGWIINKVDLSRQKITSKLCLYFIGTLLTLGLTSCVMVLICYIKNIFGQLGYFIEILLGAWMLAGRSLCDAVLPIIPALKCKDIIKARHVVSLVVGRDTECLLEDDIIRASIETIAEGLCDGVVAPLFWFAIGGLPALWGFKVISTLDSMIGHKEQPWRQFGFLAAKLDDIANFLPARITVILIMLAAKSELVLRIACRDGSKTSSPNAGYTEAAFAGALGISLGGINYYDGVCIYGPKLGNSFRLLNVNVLNEGLFLAKRVNLLSIIFGTILLGGCVYVG